MKVKLMLDSISPLGSRLTTFLVRHPGWLTVDLRKHRDLSITERKLNIKDTLQDLRPPHSVLDTDLDRAWSQVRGHVNHIAAKISWHDRMLVEMIRPYIMVESVISATNFGNFIERHRNNAQSVEMQFIVDKIAIELLKSKPEERSYHLPMKFEFIHGYSEEQTAMICAGAISDGSLEDPERYLKHAEWMKGNNHLSAFEHIANAIPINGVNSFSNFKGWVQMRKKFPQDTLI